VTAGAKVLAMTMVDLLTKPALVEQAWVYFRDVQTKDTKYQPLISAEDKPAIWLNNKTMDEYRERMRQFYYNPALHRTYLDQLGIGCPARRGDAPASAEGRYRSFTLLAARTLAVLVLCPPKQRLDPSPIVGAGEAIAGSDDPQHLLDPGDE